jgi:hypothetical protein
MGMVSLDTVTIMICNSGAIDCSAAKIRNDPY